jgi:predicted GIY-YIG superfamily endonuclease
MKVTYIYALTDPETNEPRYVGRSKNLKRRLYEHHQTKRLKTKTHKNNWIKSLIDRGLKAKIVILEECNDTNWSEREKYWVANIPNLTNTTEGGEGEFERHVPINYTPELRKKIGGVVSNLHTSGVYANSYKIFSKNYQGKKKKQSSSKFCGVFKTKNNTWLSQIRNQSKTIYLGIYKNEIDAAIAYDIKALELFGEAAKFNFPDKIGKLKQPAKTSDGNSSKYKGIGFHKNGWVATIFINGNNIYLGRFSSEEDAYRARCDYEAKVNKIVE